MLDALVERVAARDARHRPALSLVEIRPCALLHFSLMISHAASDSALSKRHLGALSADIQIQSTAYSHSGLLKGTGAFRRVVDHPLCPNLHQSTSSSSVTNMNHGGSRRTRPGTTQWVHPIFGQFSSSSLNVSDVLVNVFVSTIALLEYNHVSCCGNMRFSINPQTGFWHHSPCVDSVVLSTRKTCKWPFSDLLPGRRCKGDVHAARDLVATFSPTCLYSDASYTAHNCSPMIRKLCYVLLGVTFSRCHVTNASRLRAGGK